MGIFLVNLSNTTNPMIANILLVLDNQERYYGIFKCFAALSVVKLPLLFCVNRGKAIKHVCHEYCASELYAHGQSKQCSWDGIAGVTFCVKAWTRSLRRASYQYHMKHQTPNTEQRKLRCPQYLSVVNKLYMFYYWIRLNVLWKSNDLASVGGFITSFYGCVFKAQAACKIHFQHE